MHIKSLLNIEHKINPVQIMTAEHKCMCHEVYCCLHKLSKLLELAGQ